MSSIYPLTSQSHFFLATAIQIGFVHQCRPTQAAGMWLCILAEWDFVAGTTDKIWQVKEYLNISNIIEQYRYISQYLNISNIFIYIHIYSHIHPTCSVIDCSVQFFTTPQDSQVGQTTPTPMFFLLRFFQPLISADLVIRMFCLKISLKSSDILWQMELGCNKDCGFCGKTEQICCVQELYATHIYPPRLPMFGNLMNENPLFYELQKENNQQKIS